MLSGYFLLPDYNQEYLSGHEQFIEKQITIIQYAET